jgi:hypothetical protein
MALIATPLFVKNQNLNITKFVFYLFSPPCASKQASKQGSKEAARRSQGSKEARKQ